MGIKSALAKLIALGVLLTALGMSAQDAAAVSNGGSMPGMDHHGMGDMAGMDHAVGAMSGHHMDMGPHMKMTALRPAQPGDQQRADAVVAASRKAMAKYADYKVALDDGFQIFLPNVPQKQYHFTNYRYAFEARNGFNPDHPTSLLYEKTADGGYKLVGAMYTAPKSFSEDELNARIPLSIAQWHEHVNFCKAPEGRKSEYLGKDAKFGLRGSITTEEQCKAAGGDFHPVIFGWMVHVYPFEKNAADVWSAEKQMDHGD
jgi:hypothetical protein